MNIIEKLAEAIAEDDEDTDKQSALLLDYYDAMDELGKAYINSVFVFLCGWSLDTLRHNRHR